MKFIFIVLIYFFSFQVAPSQTAKLSQPEQDFETFWTTFRDNYAFFALKKVDWDKQYQTFHPRITPKTKPAELIKILSEMVEPLKDGHITISKGNDVLYQGKGDRNYFRTEFSGIEKEFWQNADQVLAQFGFEKVTPAGPLGRNYHPFYFTKSNELGYIRITRMFAELSGILGDEKAEKADQILMLKLLDETLEKLKDCRGVIIDLRGNGGGHSGYEMAGRFAVEKKITHYKAIRKAGDYENFSELQPFYVVPNEGVKFTRPIIILTSDRTASAAEDFVLSLYQQNNVTLVGDRTKGMFSDTFSGKLSNGIEFSLSNQRYYDLNKEVLEDKGICPKFSIRNSKKDIENRQDAVIQKAIELLKK